MNERLRDVVLCGCEMYVREVHRGRSKSRQR